MAKLVHLPNAPIVEALIDIRVRLPESTTISTLDEATGQLAADFPLKKQQQKREFSITGVAAQELHTSVEGYIVQSEDELSSVQFRRDGFTFNKLKPYTTWEDFSAQALRFWDKYVEAANPVRITRLAVRYINAVEIPRDRIDLDDYFTVAPRVPAELEDRSVIASFHSRVTAAVDDHAQVNVVLTNASNPSGPAIILDIDVFMEIDEEPGLDVRPALESLRSIKNDVFFASITEKTAALCM